MIPCAACYSRTAHAWRVLKEDEGERRALEEELHFQFRDDLPVHHLLQVIDAETEFRDGDDLSDVPAGGARVAKVVCYYGCLINRPRGVNPGDDMENPRAMERILSRFGYEALPWSFSTECCGASLSLTRDDVVRGLVDRLMEAARQAGAAAVVTGCPLCQVNLESRQTEGLPVFYFPELIGAALGLPEVSAWLRIHLVDTTPRLIVPPAGARPLRHP